MSVDRRVELDGKEENSRVMSTGEKESVSSIVPTDECQMNTFGSSLVCLHCSLYLTLKYSFVLIGHVNE